MEGTSIRLDVAESDRHAFVIGQGLGKASILPPFNGGSYLAAKPTFLCNPGQDKLWEESFDGLWCDEESY